MKRESFVTFPAQPPQIRLSIDCAILISMGRTPLCRCYRSPPPSVNSGFNLTSCDLFTRVVCDVSGFLPSLCSPSCTHWMCSCCFLVVFTSCFCSLGRACWMSCSPVMDFLPFAYPCLTFRRVITQIALGVCFGQNVWIKIMVLAIQEIMSAGAVVMLNSSIASSSRCTLFGCWYMVLPSRGGFWGTLFPVTIEDFGWRKGKKETEDNSMDFVTDWQNSECFWQGMERP